MKNNKKTLLAVVAAVAMGTLGMANAQIALPENKGVNIGLPEAVGKGNSLEQDVTPLMRSIAKKKSEVDLKALDRELEKMQDDSLKDQIAREKLLLELQQLASGQNAPAARGSVGSGFSQPSPAGSPMGLPRFNAPQEVVEAPVESIRVLMVFGFDDNLKAKVAMGSTGGYVVQKGDTLPDGRKVLRVNKGFLEVKSDSGSQRLPVSGNPPVDRSGNVSQNIVNPTAIPLNGGTTQIVIPASLPAIGQ